MLRSGAPEKSFMSECVSDVDLNNVLTAVWWNVSRETYLINMHVIIKTVLTFIHHFGNLCTIIFNMKAQLVCYIKKMSKSNHFFKLKVKSRHRYTSSWRAGVITAPRHSNFYTFYTFTETSGSTENITASVHLKPSDTTCETARQLHFVSSEVHASDLREDDFTWARSTWLLSLICTPAR